jgi:hypothetical protein
VGQRLLDVVGKKMIGQGLDKLNVILQDRMAQQAGEEQQKGGSATLT